MARLKRALMIQEGRALGEEHRQGGQADVGHGILPVGSRARVWEPLTAAPHDAQPAVEHLHPDLESDPTGQNSTPNPFPSRCGPSASPPSTKMRTAGPVERGMTAYSPRWMPKAN